MNIFKSDNVISKHTIKFKMDPLQGETLETLTLPLKSAGALVLKKPELIAPTIRRLFEMMRSSSRMQHPETKKLVVVDISLILTYALYLLAGGSDPEKHLEFLQKNSKSPVCVTSWNVREKKSSI